jgi:hypothetical protein
MEFKHITEAVIAKQSALKERIDAALALDPNRAPDEWVESNKTGQGNLPDLLGLQSEVREGRAWEHLTSLIRKVWKGEPITLPPVSVMMPIYTESAAAAAPSKTISLEKSALSANFIPLDVNFSVPVPSEEVGVRDAEKPETWEPLLDDWIQEEFSHLFAGMIESHSAEVLTEWVIGMLERVSGLEIDEKVKIDQLKLFLSSVSSDVLRPFLTRHIATLMQEHKMGYSAAEVARWRNEHFIYFAEAIRSTAQGQKGIDRDLVNDFEKLTKQALAILKDWKNHIDRQWHPEAEEIYAELAEYWAANQAQFEQQLGAVFEELVAAQRL